MKSKQKLDACKECGVTYFKENASKHKCKSIDKFVHSALISKLFKSKNGGSANEKNVIC